MLLPDVGDDERFSVAIAHFNAEEFDVAADLFEELFFEAVRDEVELVRALLQIATAIHHVERNQFRAAAERLEEGIRAIEAITNARGVDLVRLGQDAVALRAAIALRASGDRTQIEWPRILRGSSS